MYAPESTGNRQSGLMKIREAEASDVPALEVIRRQAIEAGFTDVYERETFAPLVATPDEALPERVREPAWLVLVAESEVTAVGFAALETATGRIQGPYTAPNHWGQGCARRLIDRFVDRAQSEGLALLRADAPRNALGFFERCGFEKRQTVEGAIERIRVVKSL